MYFHGMRCVSSSAAEVKTRKMMYIGKNVEQRRAIDQEEGFGDGAAGAGVEIKIEEIVQAGAIAARCDGNGDEEDECEQQRVIEVEA